MIGGICNLFASTMTSSIDLFEWNRDDVLMPRLPNRPEWDRYAASAGTLPLTGIGLAHAVVKADFLITRNYALPSLGFLLQMDQIIDFASAENLRSLPGAAAILNDVSQTGLGGRIAQGLALLFAERRGYNFAAHLGSDPAVQSFLISTGNRRAADLVFENEDGKRMILESVGTFSLADNECSEVKRVLKRELTDQVDPWMQILAPDAAEGFVVYSCLRETRSTAPSAMMFVAAPGPKDGCTLELRREWVLRHNFAGWLRVMGLREAADRLRSVSRSQKAAREPDRLRLRLAELGSRRFAIVTSHERNAAFPDKRFAIGMELDVFRCVCAALAGEPAALLAIRPASRDDYKLSTSFSAFRDGTLFGMIDVSDIGRSEEFLL